METVLIAVLPWQTRLMDAEYRQLSLLIAERAGICLGSGVREYVAHTVRRQMARRGISGFSEYIRQVENDDGGGMIRQICANLNFARCQSRFDRQEPEHATA